MGEFDALDVENIITCLEKTPDLLRNLLSAIPKEFLRARRGGRPWTIHEHACHVASGDRPGFLERLARFMSEDRPWIQPLSGNSFPKNYLWDMDLEQALERFAEERAEALRLSKAAPVEFWAKEADHPEYILYTPHTMLRHRLMHDHLHMYRIEELWLTKDDVF